MKSVRKEKITQNKQVDYDEMFTVLLRGKKCILSNVLVDSFALVNSVIADLIAIFRFIDDDMQF